MDSITFQTGLVLQYGDRVYEFLKMLDNNQVQFEEQLTRHTKTLTIAQILHDIQKKKAYVVRVASLGKRIPEKPEFDNSLEFHSSQFRLAALELQLEIKDCCSRTPWSKVLIEHFFAELNYLDFPPKRVRKPKKNVR